MKKKLKWQIGFLIVYIILLIIIVILIKVLEWSWWTLFWSILIPVILYLITILILFAINRTPEVKEKKETIDIEEMIEYIDNWRINKSKNVADYSMGESQASIYTPHQEKGEEKMSMRIIQRKGYWYDDVIFYATPTTQKKILMYKSYPIDYISAEDDFKKEIDNAVPNPIILSEKESIRRDVFGGEVIVKEKTHRQLLEDKKKEQIKKEEEDEGVISE